MTEAAGGEIGVSSRSSSRIAVAVDYDPGVWLAGPTDGDAQGWISRALAAVCTDFAIADGTPEQGLLRDVLRAFAVADLGCDFRFLRLRSLSEPPVLAMLHVDAGELDGAPAHGDAALTTYAAGTRWYDRDPELTVVDEGTGLRRAVRYAVDDDGRVSSVVRYHRRVPELGADVVLSSAGADPRATALALADLDDLARAVRLVDGGGRPG